MAISPTNEAEAFFTGWLFAAAMAERGVLGQVVV